MRSARLRALRSGEVSPARSASADRADSAARRRVAKRPDGRRRTRRGDAGLVLDQSDTSLLDIVDNVLNKGVVLSGDLTIALAQVDLIYARLSLLLCAADRVLPTEHPDLMKRHHNRRARRVLPGRSLPAVARSAKAGVFRG